MNIENSIGAGAQRVCRALPLCFFGLSFWRAWANMLFAAPSPSIPLSAAADHGLFDGVMLCAFVLLIPLAHRISPLNVRHWPYRLCLALMTLHSLASALSLWVPNVLRAAPFFTAGAAVGGALMILLWSELYAGLSPFKVLVGLTGSYALAPVIVFILNGFIPTYQVVAVLLLPVASIGCLRLAVSQVSLTHLRSTGRGTVPWAIIVVMAIYGFASGLSGTRMSEFVGANSSLTTLVVSGALYLTLVLLANRISFGTVQKLPPAFMVASLGLLSVSTIVGSWAMQVGVTAAVLLSYFYADTSLCDISRRFGISVVWLFSIEEAFAMGFERAGQVLGDALAASPWGQTSAYLNVLSAVLIALSTIATLVLLNPRVLTRHWGINFTKAGALAQGSDRLQRQSQWVDAMATTHRLSTREAEVLGLLVAGDSMRTIAQKLVVSEGTAKSHASHIYEKLGVSGKRELEAIAQSAIGANSPTEDA